MDIREYRKRCEAEVKQAGNVDEGLAVPEAQAALSDKSAAPEARVAAIESTPIEPEGLGAFVGRLLSTLRDREEPTPVRSAALRALKAAAFLGPRFTPYRAEYLQALREAATDPEPGVREDALEVLAIEKDHYAQELLLRGMRDPKAALVPLTKALQSLAYDVHADVVPVVRDVFKRATGAAKEEALRLLASDPGSARLFTDLLKDKSQKSAIRRLSATALQNLNPEVFARVAREIVTDDGDYEEIRASALAALAHGQLLGASLADTGLAEQIESLKERTRSTRLRSSIKRFLQARQR